MESKHPWYADYVNYLACGVLSPDLSFHQKKKFLHDVKSFLWEYPLLFKRSPDQIIRRCVPEDEMLNILKHSDSSEYGDILVQQRQLQRYFNQDSFGQRYLKMPMHSLSLAIVVKESKIFHGRTL